MAEAVLTGTSSAVFNQITGAGSTNTTEAERQKQAEAEELENTFVAFRCFRWLCQESPTLRSKCEFVGWIILAILVPVSYGVYINMADEGSSLNWGYILCAVLSLLLGAYATANFSNILELKEAVKKWLESITELRKVGEDVKREISNLDKVRKTLAQIEEEQSVSNARLRHQRQQFEQWSALTTSSSASNQQQALRIQQRFVKDIRERERRIQQAEKDILYNALRAFEKMEDGQSGLNEDEFQLFLDHLPERYKAKIAVKGFYEYSKSDELIDSRDFKEVLDAAITQDIEQLAQAFGIYIPGVQDDVPQPALRPDQIERKEEETVELQVADNTNAPSVQ